MLTYIATKLKCLRFSLRSKIGAAFFLVLIGFIFNGLISIALLFGINETWSKQKQTAAALEKTQQYQIIYKNKLDVYLGSIFITKNARFVDNRDFEALLSQLMSESSQQDFERQLARQYLLVFDKLTKLKDLVSSEKFDEAQKLWRESEPSFKEVSVSIADRIGALKTESLNTDAELKTAIFTAIGLALGITILSIGLTLITLTFVRLIIVQPINQLQKALDEMAQGDLLQAQDFKIENQDEIGQLAQSFRLALTAVQNMVKGVQITGSLESLSVQLASVSQQQAAGSTTQLTAFTQVITSIQELSRTASSIAENSAQMANRTSSTKDQISQIVVAAQQGGKRVKQIIEVTHTTLSGISLMERQINGLHRNIIELNTQTTSINRVLDLLTAISNEVKILALNAGIEAASAGQYGDRFKEIARQVRELAMRANRATVEARELIEMVQGSSRVTVGQAEEGLSTVGQLSQQNELVRHSLADLESSVEITNEAIEELVTFAAQVTEQTQEIKVATHQQQLASEQVVMSAQSAEEVTRQNAETSGYLATGSQELRELTTQLGRVLGQIRLAA